MENKLKEAFLHVWRNKKISNPQIGDKRWLNNNEIIELSVNKTTNRNAEFIINGHPNHLMWYSQFSEIFFNLDTMSLCSGSIKKHNGESIYVRDMTHEAFADYVTGKKFKVILNPEGEVAKINWEKLPQIIYYEDAANIIRNLCLEGKYSEAASYLVSGQEYELLEL